MLLSIEGATRILEHKSSFSSFQKLKILKLKNDKIMYERYSSNSRELALNTYDKSILVPRIIQIIDSINHV